MAPSKASRAAPPELKRDPRVDQLGGTIDQLNTDRVLTPQGRDLNAEARIQAAVVAWARLVAPEAIVFAIPNGGLRSKPEAARLKWTGVLAGVPDLAVVVDGGKLFFLEVKAPGGSLSADQRAFRDLCATLNIPFAIARSIDGARAAFRAWNIETREAS